MKFNCRQVSFCPFFSGLESGKASLTQFGMVCLVKKIIAALQISYLGNTFIHFIYQKYYDSIITLTVMVRRSCRIPEGGTKDLATHICSCCALFRTNK